MRAKTQMRQGDVLIESVETIPSRPITDQRLLIRGEGRNHGHFLLGDNLTIYKAVDNELDEFGAPVAYYLDVQKEATLEHLLVDAKIWTKEHDKIYIPPGRYRIIRQREYDPYERTIRILKD